MNEVLPRKMECLSATTSWLEQTASTLTTSILNFRKSITHITPYHLRLKLFFQRRYVSCKCFTYTWLFFVVCLRSMSASPTASTADTYVYDELYVERLTVVVDQTVRLNCSYDHPIPVDWKHDPVGPGDPNTVHHGGFGMPWLYRTGGRHSIEAGTNNLMIVNVTDSDAGLHTCVDWDVYVLEPDINAYDFVVMKSLPSCQSNIDLTDVIGENDCGIDPDQILLQCSVVYTGNFAPVLRWQNSGGEHPMVDANVSVSIRDEANYITSSTLTMTANRKLTDTYFTCQVADSPSVSSAAECRTEKLAVHYVYNSSIALDIGMASEKEISCVANSSQSCHYRWTTNHHQKYEITFPGSTLNVRDLSIEDGIYKCHAECRFRGQTCATMPLQVTAVAGGIGIDDGNKYERSLLMSLLSPLSFWSLSVFLY